MNVLATSLSLILIGLAMIHPAFFLSIDKLVRKNNIPRKYLQMNYVIHLSAGLISVLLYWLYRVNYPLQIAGLVYVGVIIIIVLFYWNSELTKWNLFTASTIFGFIIFYRSINEIVEIFPLWPGILTGLLNAVALSIIIFLLFEAIHTLTNKKTQRFRAKYIKFLYMAIGVRIAWQIGILFNLSVATQYGETISAILFFWQIDPVRLMFVIILGMIVPCFYLLLIRKPMLSLNSSYRWLTILLLFLSIFIAEIFNKYFLLQFGIVL